MTTSQPSLHAQRGVSLSGLLGLIAIIIVLFMLGAKIFPTYLEYKSAKAGIASAKKEGDVPAQIRSAFDRQADINAVTSVTGNDLMVEKVGNEVEVSFDYDKKISLMKNVDLVIRYAATTAPDGKVPERDETPVKK